MTPDTECLTVTMDSELLAKMHSECAHTYWRAIAIQQCNTTLRRRPAAALATTGGVAAVSFIF